MKLQSSFIFSWVLAFFCFTALDTSAQDVQEVQTGSYTVDVPEVSSEVLVDSATVLQDSLTIVEADSIAPKIIYPFLREASLIWDYGKIFGYLTGVEKKNELGIQLNIKKMFTFHLEAGYSILNPNDAFVNADYEIKGSYFRIGAGINKSITEKNNLTLSFRYARANFEDNGTVRVASSSGLFDDLESPFSRTSLGATWYEFVLGSEKAFNSKFHMGFYIRFRIMDKYDIQDDLDVFAIPGYGRTFDKTIPALNLYLRYVFANTTN